MEPLENLFEKVGLTTPTSRFVAVAAVSEGAYYYFKPAVFFNSDGTPREWSLLNPSAVNGTILPHYVAAAGLGILFSVLL